MEKFKKYFKEVNDFAFNVLIAITLIWGMYLAVALTIEVPILGIPILVISIVVAILMKKKETKMEKQ